MRILFVCTGNICRSPMAEAVARRLVVRTGGVEVSSAGIHGLEGAPASNHALTALAEVGIDGSAHVARSLSAGLIAAADRIYVMTEAHRRWVLAVDWEAPVELLDRGGADIDDPYGRPLEDYRRALREIVNAVRERVSDWG